MLREVMKNFDGENNTPLKSGDIVDVSGWKNRQTLEDQKMIAITDATEATVDPYEEKEPVKVIADTHKMPIKLKRSALASRPRVFQRKA